MYMYIHIENMFHSTIYSLQVKVFLQAMLPSTLVHQNYSWMQCCLTDSPGPIIVVEEQGNPAIHAVISTCDYQYVLYEDL